jgi:hypothetical protein
MMGARGLQALCEDFPGIPPQRHNEQKETSGMAVWLMMAHVCQVSPLAVWRNGD